MPATAAADEAPNPQPTCAKEDRTCAQCRGPVDGKEHQIPVEGKTVWLHPECRRFYLPDYPALPDSLNRNLHNGAGGQIRGTGSMYPWGLAVTTKTATELPIGSRRDLLAASPADQDA